MRRDTGSGKHEVNLVRKPWAEQLSELILARALGLLVKYGVDGVDFPFQNVHDVIVYYDFNLFKTLFEILLL